MLSIHALCQNHVVTASADYASNAPHTNSPHAAHFEPQKLQMIQSLLWIVYYS